LKELGKALRCNIIREEDSSMLLGRKVSAQMLEEYPDIDALFFANDELVSGALLYCLSEGISVPQV
jgi:LacI family gluconate utilization system Gnt-I transcriptional repressor